MVARFRCGAEERGRQRWRRDEGRRCRVCGQADETLEHMLADCLEGVGTMEEILDGTGGGIEIMKFITKSRERP